MCLALLEGPFLLLRQGLTDRGPSYNRTVPWTLAIFQRNTLRKKNSADIHGILLGSKDFINSAT